MSSQCRVSLTTYYLLLTTRPRRRRSGCRPGWRPSSPGGAARCSGRRSCKQSATGATPRHCAPSARRCARPSARCAPEASKSVSQVSQEVVERLHELRG
eukprot:scaffold126637_cov51-Phaeocystis_antarctica.AAC.2